MKRTISTLSPALHFPSSHSPEDPVLSSRGPVNFPHQSRAFLLGHSSSFTTTTLSLPDSAPPVVHSRSRSSGHRYSPNHIPERDNGKHFIPTPADSALFASHHHNRTGSDINTPEDYSTRDGCSCRKSLTMLDMFSLKRKSIPPESVPAASPSMLSSAKRRKVEPPILPSPQQLTHLRAAQVNAYKPDNDLYSEARRRQWVHSLAEFSTPDAQSSTESVQPDMPQASPAPFAYDSVKSRKLASTHPGYSQARSSPTWSRASVYSPMTQPSRSPAITPSPQTLGPSNPAKATPYAADSMRLDSLSKVKLNVPPEIVVSSGRSSSSSSSESTPGSANVQSPTTARSPGGHRIILPEPTPSGRSRVAVDKPFTGPPPRIQHWNNINLPMLTTEKSSWLPNESTIQPNTSQPGQSDQSRFSGSFENDERPMQSNAVSSKAGSPTWQKLSDHYARHPPSAAGHSRRINNDQATSGSAAAGSGNPNHSRVDAEPRRFYSIGDYHSPTVNSASYYSPVPLQDGSDKSRALNQAVYGMQSRESHDHADTNSRAHPTSPRTNRVLSIASMSERPAAYWPDKYASSPVATPERPHLLPNSSWSAPESIQLRRSTGSKLSLPWSETLSPKDRIRQSQTGTTQLSQSSSSSPSANSNPIKALTVSPLQSPVDEACSQCGIRASVIAENPRVKEELVTKKKQWEAYFSQDQDEKSKLRDRVKSLEDEIVAYRERQDEHAKQLLIANQRLIVEQQAKNELQRRNEDLRRELEMQRIDHERSKPVGTTLPTMESRIVVSFESSQAISPPVTTDSMRSASEASLDKDADVLLSDGDGATYVNDGHAVEDVGPLRLDEGFHQQVTVDPVGLRRSMEFTARSPFPVLSESGPAAPKNTAARPGRKQRRRLLFDGSNLMSLHVHRAGRFGKRDLEEPKPDPLGLMLRNVVPVVKEGCLAFREGVVDPRTRRLKRGVPVYKVGRRVPGELL